MPEVRYCRRAAHRVRQGPGPPDQGCWPCPGGALRPRTEPRHLTLPGHEVLLALRTANVLIRLEGLPGGAQLALPKAIQRDPIKGYVEHVDLLVVRRGEKVTVDVPINDRPARSAPDGLLDQQLVQITVEAEATNIPPGIDVCVEGMAVGDAVHASDLELPTGSTLAVEPEVLVLHVIAAPTAEQIEAEIGEAGGRDGCGWYCR